MNIPFSFKADWIRRYPLVWLLCLAILLGVVYLLTPFEKTRDILSPQGEGDRVYFGGDTTVAQEFIPAKGLYKISVPLGTEAALRGPLILHLRPLVGEEDLVVSPIFSLDGDEAVFEFTPITRLPEKVRFVLEAPHSLPKSFWVYREQDESVFSEGNILVNGRPIRGNIGFSETWRQPRLLNVRDVLTLPSLSAWERSAVWLGLVLAAVWLYGRRWQTGWMNYERWAVAVFILIGFFLHIAFSFAIPIVNDEGAYIQDVLQLRSDLLPFRDFLTKGPAYLVFLWLWKFIIPNTILAWRLFSAVAWAGAGVAFWLFLQEWGLSKKSRLLAVAALTLMPAAVSLTVPILLQIASVPVVLIGFLLALKAVRRTDARLAAWAGGFMALAFFIRVSSVVPALMAALLLFGLSLVRLRLLAIYVLTGIVLFAIVFGAGVAVAGVQKAAVLVNAEALFIAQNRQDIAQVAEQGEPLIRSVVIELRLLWRTGLLTTKS